MTTETATPPPEPTTEEVVIAGLSPQTLACLLMGVILFGVVVSGAYIMTRRTVHAEPAPVAALVQPAAAPAPVVTKPEPPPQPQAQSQPQAPPQTQPQPQPQTLTITADETRGKTFLQVGAIERTAVPSYVQGLASRGFVARVAEGPEPAIVRILIGPLSGDDFKDMTAKLTSAGITSFPRTY